MGHSSNNKRKVLILEPSGNLWGSERVLLDLLRSELLSTWHVGLCCPPDTLLLSELKSIRADLFPHFPVNLHLKNRIKRLAATARLLHVARKFRPQVLYVNQAGATKIALAVGVLLRIPVVTHVRLVEDVGYVLSLRQRKRLGRTICVSNFIRQLFHKPEGHDLLRTVYDPYSRRCDWSGSPPIQNSTDVICVGRLVKSKRQDLVIRSIAHLKSENHIIKASFVGSGIYAAELAELALELRVSEHIEWSGFQRDVFPRLSRAGMLVCPSDTESLGRVIFEAWDAGIVPIAWTGSGGAAEVIRSSGGGVLYDKQEPSSLAEAIRDVTKMTVTERQYFITNGRKWLRSNCDVETYAQSITLLFEEVLKPRGDHYGQS